ncbi:Peptidase family M50 [compost metagenome]
MICILVVQIVHELGHVIAGAVNRLSFIEITVGFIKIERSGKKLRLLQNKDMQLAGGYVKFLPKDYDKSRLVAKWKWFIIAGPLCSLAFACIAFVLQKTSAQPLEFIFNSMGILSLALSIITILPHSIGGQPSDGAIYLMLCKNDSEADSYLYSLMMMSFLYSPNPPKAWPAVTVEEAYKSFYLTKRHISSSHGIREANLCVLFYYYYFDCRNFAKIKEVFELFDNHRRKSRNLRKHSPYFEGFNGLLITHHCLWGEPDLDDVYNKLPNMDQYSRHRALAAILVKEQRFPEAMDALGKAKAIYEKNLSKFGFSKVEALIIDEIHKRSIQGT